MSECFTFGALDSAQWKKIEEQNAHESLSTLVNLTNDAILKAFPDPGVRGFFDCPLRWFAVPNADASERGSRPTSSSHTNTESTEKHMAQSSRVQHKRSSSCLRKDASRVLFRPPNQAAGSASPPSPFATLHTLERVPGLAALSLLLPASKHRDKVWLMV